MRLVNEGDKVEMGSNREEYLKRAIAILSRRFEANSYVVPAVKVSVGFPGGGSAKKRIGEHWSPESSDDKMGSIFISPVLSDSIEVLGVLVHEMVHAVAGNKAGHGPVFKRIATAMGLTGKMRSTTIGPELESFIRTEVIQLIGDYPHAKLNLSMGRKKQTTRLIKQVCNSCEYIVRSSQSVIDTHGPVICPGCHETMVIG